MNYNEIRKKTRKIKIGNRTIGGDSPIAVQSMTNTDSGDFSATYAQMKALEAAGCDIVRMTVPDMAAAKTIERLKSSDISIPIVADIHFDYRLALAAADAGADKIRIRNQVQDLACTYPSSLWRAWEVQLKHTTIKDL